MPRRFYKVHIEISNICNLQCSFCPEVIRTKGMIDVEVFRQTVEQVAPYTKVVSLHLMGDPLVHPRLAELVEICDQKGLKIFLVTNGVLLREKEAEILLHPAFRQINFSLHSFADNFGERDPGPYLEKIFRFTEKAFEKRPRLFINYRLWNLSESLGQRSANLEILRRIEERFQISVPAVWDTRIQKNLLVKNKLSLHFDTEFTWPSLDLPLQGETGTCYGLASHFGVLVDGTVVPCCLDKEGVIALGNIRGQPLSDILGGPRAQAMRKGFQENRLVEDLCQRCQYIERFQQPVLASLFEKEAKQSR